MKKPIRVLYVHGGKLNYGGTESYMMNYYRHFDRTKLQIDFAVHGFERGVFEDEIEAMGGQVFYLPIKSKDYFGNLKGLRNLFQSGDYQIVHSQMDGMNAVVLREAKKCGIPVRISHSHNTRHQTTSKWKRKLNDYAKGKIPKYATDLFACSDLAGGWLYEGKPFRVLNNAIDTQAYRFDPKKRSRVREAFGIGDRLLVGHVGRLHFQKNHDFLLEVFWKLYQAHPESMLMLVGEGERRGEIEAKITAYGLQKAVILTGNRPDIPLLLQGMDVFLFPSFFEGFPVTLVEAQAAGLPCVIANTITRKVALTDRVIFLSLDTPTQEWAARVWVAETGNRDGYSDQVKFAGFDITQEARTLQEFYLDRAFGSRKKMNL